MVRRVPISKDWHWLVVANAFHLRESLTNPRPLRGPQPQDDDMNKFLEAFHALLIFSVVLFFWVMA